MRDLPFDRPAIVLAGAALLVTAVILAVATQSPSANPHTSSAPGSLRIPERLPDLDQETPSQLEVQTVLIGGRRTHRLGFRSAVRNIGAGPLIVVGSRPDTGHPSMRVDQLIDRVGAGPRVVPGVGRMRYVVSPGHRHWHYVGFEHYELQTFEMRSAESRKVVATDHKTGFCLGDRYPVTRVRLTATPPRPVYTGRCGLTQPDRLRVRAGISVGYGDDYFAFLEGQDLPLDGLAEGRYVLVHRVNEDHGLWERSYVNNASSVLLDLRWQGGEPALRLLERCPETDQCDRQPEDAGPG